MKMFMIMAALLVSSNAFASEDISTEALKVLMGLNPVATAGDGTKEQVSDLVAPMMLSKFEQDGTGYLSVVKNSCRRRSSGTYSCTLNIVNSDRVLTQRGSYVPARGMTESSLTIRYTMAADGVTLYADTITYDFAG